MRMKWVDSANSCQQIHIAESQGRTGELAAHLNVLPQWRHCLVTADNQFLSSGLRMGCTWTSLLRTWKGLNMKDSALQIFASGSINFNYSRWPEAQFNTNVWTWVVTDNIMKSYYCLHPQTSVLSSSHFTPCNLDFYYSFSWQFDFCMVLFPLGQRLSGSSKIRYHLFSKNG